MHKYILILFFLFSYFVYSQNFEVQLSQNKVGLNETFEISFILDDSGKSFSPPPFSDFQILRGPSKSSSTSVINGSFTQELRYSYVLKPKKTGVFTILPASIKVNGKTIGTNPVTIQVQKGTVSKNTNSPYNIVSKNIHLEVTSSQKQCYVGEPIVLTYTLYFNLNIGSLSSNTIKYPDFWTNSLDVNSETKKVIYKEKQYNSAVVKQVVLVPRVPGRKEIDQFQIDLVVSVPTGRRDFFNMITNQNLDYTVTSNNLKITILELPSNGRPIDFSGAIGDFDLSVNLDKDSMGVNESATFSVKIAGQGNLNLINSPAVNFDSQLEVFEPKNVDKIKITKKGIQGYKKEEYLIVPRHKGLYSLAPISFNFFNPKLKKYISLTSKKTFVKVGGNDFNNESYSISSINKEKIDLLNEDIKFIKTDNNLLLKEVDFGETIVFYLLIFFAVFILILAVLKKYNYINLDVFFSQSIFKQTLTRLDAVKLLLKEKKYKDFQSELLLVLLLYVSNKFSISKAVLGEKKIKHTLLKHNFSKAVVLDYLELIGYLEKCRYSPHVGDKINLDLYNRALNLINKIEGKK